MTETKVYIRDLRLHAYHGVLQQERTVGNEYIVNISVAYPWQDAMSSDDVADTLNYATLADLVVREMSVPSRLLEHVAGRIVTAVRNDFPLATSVSLDIRKVAPPIPHDTGGCGVELFVTF